MRALGVYQYSIHILLLAVFLLFLALTGSGDGDERDRLALLAFKSKITHDPQGAFRSWNNSLHFCNWEGIICSNRHRRRVTALDLSSKGLVGSLSPGIGNLSFLQEIILSNNALQGIIPQELGHLSRLKVLILKYNNLQGEIPKNISHSSNLIQLSLAGNKLMGKLPIELASLSKLQQLVLDFNDFTGEIPPFIGNLTSLQVLSASQNAFTGYVSVDFGSLLHLQKLLLGSNNLGSGEQGDLKFLGSLANCSSLEKLELGGNNFGGSLPGSIANISTAALTWINLAGNQISGSIPSEICKFINLIYLNFGANKFIGLIPSEFVKLGKLQRVVLSNNRLVGKIPDSIGNLSMLDQLQFDNNKLEGTIPPCFGNCRMLVLLDLSQNNLTGTIPNELFYASPFSIVLNLSQNHLVGSIPADIGLLKTMGEFDVSQNELSGVVPNEIGGCTGLEKLYIQGNFIQGSIPYSVEILRGIQNVDFSHNNFTGRIPDFLETMSLKYLNLSLNDFEGEVPVIGVYANLSAFSVVGNKRLCGGIPNLQLPRCSIEGSHKHKISRAQAIIFIASFLLTFTMVSSFYYFCQRKKKQPYSKSISMVSSLNFLRRTLPLVSFFKVSYDDLYTATNGFSLTNLVSEGGSGSVYKGIFGRGYNGILDEDEVVVAVKVLRPQFGGASNRVMAKVETFRDIRHRNLVEIITTCSSVDRWGQGFCAIVYEFMQHGSLESWLHSTQEAYQDGLNKPHKLDIHTRINIVIDVACALDYLHNQYGNPIIHCNLKPSNILLGSDMTAHVTDIGLPKFLPESPNLDRSSSVGLQGSSGYVPPEYGLGSMVSTKGDVYSYGILLLEMLTGKKPTDPMFHGGLNLHNFVSNALPDRVMDIIDPVNLPLPEFSKELIIMFNIGVKCTMESPQVRPHIRDVLSVLETVKTMFKKKGFVEPYLNDSSQAAALMAKEPMKSIPHRRRPDSRSMLISSSFKVSYEVLHKATNGFSLTNLVGAGGFGSVYKGIFGQQSAHFHLQYSGIGDGDGTVLAVKVFNFQCRGAVPSFTAECTVLRNISYKNLVKLIATCTSVDEEGHDFRAIIYEFMEHGSLEGWLHSAKKKHHDGLNKPRILNVHTRINIAIDVACALDYLHHQCEKPIIHCDLKPSNILLDRDMIAHVADFGLATFLPKSPNPNSYQSSSIGLRGTTGYIPPEYGLGSMMSTKGDVYSFGILLLEMLTGKKPTHRMFHGGINLHNFAWMALPDRIMDISDPVMKRMTSADENDGNQMRECLTKMFDIGVKCSKPSPQVRPDIGEVLHELKSLKDILKEIEMQPTSPFRD